MRLKYNIFKVEPIRLGLSRPSTTVPADMLRYDPAFYNPAFPDKVIMVWWPGLLKKVMNGTPERWASFGFDITKIQSDEVTKNVEAWPEQWWTIREWKQHGCDALGYTLYDFTWAKNTDALHRISRQVPYTILGKTELR